ncbi:MAG: LPS assembly lipoprotein LptE [Caulobacter sp.]|nr:LPS assembly lipoprotein LptE [Caulobacter sp.]
MQARLFALALLLATPALAGCGFTPLYAVPGVSPGLSSIETVAPEGRTGFLLRQSLDDAFARDAAKPPVWRLTIDLKETRTPRGRRVDAAASRYELELVANWKLTNVATGAVVRDGMTRTEVTFDRADQPYAAIVANQDGQARAAAELARKIQLQLADWMAGGASAD